MSTADVPLVASVPLVRLEAPPADRGPVSAAAHGEVGTLGGILLRGFALTIVTLGIYRFWMKTEIRRWYWSNTVISGDALEYRGTGRELFIGFLFAVGILLPIYGVVVGGTYISGILSWQAASQTFFVAFLLLAQYAAYRARRYRMTRTAWRGLAFSQGGSGWTYAGLWILGALASIASLGFAVPWVRARLEGYRIRHTRFGTAQAGPFTPALGELAARWALLWAPALAIAMVALAWVYAEGGLRFLIDAVVLLLGFGETEINDAPAGLFQAVLVLLGALGVGLAWALLVWPAYKSAEFRAFTAATRLGPVTFRSSVRAGWYYGALLRFLAMTAVLAGAVGILGWLVLEGSISAGLLVSGAELIVMLVLVALYLLFFIGFVILRELIIVQGFWRHALSTLEVSGLDRLDDVIASGQADRAVGEGLADAFEIGGF